MANVKPVPEGFHTATPYLAVRGASAAIEFYKRAFSAQEISRMTGPDGKVAHAEIRIGDSPVMLADEAPEWGNQSPAALGGTPVNIFLYVPDVDTVYQRALDAGAQSRMAPADMFWGDRFSKITDPFGHEWGIATHIEDVAPEEMKKREQAFREQMAQGQQKQAQG
ncbi:MAG: VOC family protein [Acidobacteria bacterium]|nr:VOC family protein [Acidobacteriota bacterium]